MGLFGQSKSQKLIAEQSLQIKALSQDVIRLTSLTSRLSTNIFPDYKAVANNTRYCTTDDIYSIINLVASTAACIPIYPYIKQGDKLVDVPETDPLAIFLENPFLGMTGEESRFAMIATKLIHGNALAYKEKPELGPNTGKLVRLHYLAPQGISMKIASTFPHEVISYTYTVNGIKVYEDIPPEDIIHIKTFNPTVDNFGINYWGLSILEVLTKRSTRMDRNMDASVSQLQNGGVNTIVFEKSEMDPTGEYLKRRRDDYYTFVSSSYNAGGAYFADGELGAIQLGLKMADLQVAELEKIDFKKLCNAFKVSDRLFNNDATGSEISDKSARVALYTNAALPEVKALIAAYKKWVLPEFKGNYCLKEDISEIPELQTNYKELAEAFAAAPIFIPNTVLDAFKMEKSGDPLADEVYIKAGYNLLSDMAAPDILPPTGDYGQGGN